jgi:competence protein ComEC
MSLEFRKLVFFAFILAVVDAVFLGFIVFGGGQLEDGVYFLDVGQADSEVVVAQNAVFLIDAGRDAKVIKNLEKIIPQSRKRIDVAIISHGQIDHAGGMFFVVDNYDVGYVLYNGEDNQLWRNLKQLLEAKNIPYLRVLAKDRIIFGKNLFDILWPESFDFSNSNDNSMVVKYKNENYSVLFSADISSKVESKLLLKDIFSDILKVPHHGSKYSSSKSFIERVNPKISVIEVGKNSYGHPTSEAIKNLYSIGSKIFRTDKDGLIKIKFTDGKLVVFSIN